MSTAEGTGAELLKQCKDAVNFRDNSGPTNFKVGQCLGYLSGLTDTANYYHKKKIRNAPNFCLPTEVTLGQEVMIVVKYLESHPEKLQETRFILAMTALKNAFPCNEK
jgi:NAD dependent epimerase/dehydratase family enzyme